MTTSRGSENHGEASRFFMYVEIRPFESAMPSIVTAPPDSLSEVRLTPSGRVLTISSKKCTVAERLACRFSITRIRASRRSEEHTSELQSLMRISYAVFCLKKKKKIETKTHIKKAEIQEA